MFIVFFLQVYAFLHLGRWSAKTGGVLSGPFTIHWLSVGLEAHVPVNSVQLNDLFLEIIDEAGESGGLIGSGRAAIHAILGYIMLHLSFFMFVVSVVDYRTH